MKKTITINGKKYTGRQISKLMDASSVTDGAGSKFVKINGEEFVCQYRHDDHDGYFAPLVGDRNRANCILAESTRQFRKEWIIL